MRHLVRLISFSAILVLAVSMAGQTKAKSSPILPQIFAGWEIAESTKSGSDAAQIDPGSAKVLKEYGLSDYEIATYKNGARTLVVKAARFQDASGAYGAFTFYRTQNMQPETVGTMAASANERVLFFRSNILVTAEFDHITAMSAGELRELAQDLPAASGSAGNLPNLPNYFPKRELVANSAKFIVGPEALAMTNAPISADQIDFSKDPEVMTGRYSAGGHDADFVLIEYPTPQIAGERLRAIETANPTSGGTTFLAKRTGPLVALIKGQVPESDARRLLARVNYEADVTWNENAGNSKRDNIGNLVIAASLLAGIIFLISVGTGAIFGFGRIFLHRLFPKRYAVKDAEGELIRLHLEK